MANPKGDTNQCNFNAQCCTSGAQVHLKYTSGKWMPGCCKSVAHYLYIGGIKKFSRTLKAFSKIENVNIH